MAVKRSCRPLTLLCFHRLSRPIHPSPQPNPTQPNPPIFTPHWHLLLLLLLLLFLPRPSPLLVHLYLIAIYHHNRYFCFARSSSIFGLLHNPPSSRRVHSLSPLAIRNSASARTAAAPALRSPPSYGPRFHLVFPYRHRKLVGVLVCMGHLASSH
ncbi:hypothetical protein EX30DRAFT_254747 [Ascodesmis nigricans]|uniref:Uncharacterized protein n=1 Tax=Ascodesmis nigricans TaxID=341454 RepID=A0A4S2MYB0_9PEZI|nr:hypothetical protein EX30DRAFT_254747 [Ascodesmis nigricans]